MIFKLSIAAFLFLFITTFSSAEGVYRWKDDSGNLHFSSSPPKKQNAEKIHVKTPSPSSDTSTKQELSTKNTKQEKPTKQHEASTSQYNRTETEDKVIKERCDQVKSNLKTLRSSKQVKIKDDQGGTKWLPAEEHQAMLKKNQEYLEAYCK